MKEDANSEVQWTKTWDMVPEAAPKDPNRDRLPHLAEFHASYDAVSVKWTITLSTSVGDKAESFCIESSGLFPGLMRLDREYRTKAGLPKRKSKKPNGKKRSGQL